MAVFACASRGQEPSWSMSGRSSLAHSVKYASASERPLKQMVAEMLNSLVPYLQFRILASSKGSREDASSSRAAHSCPFKISPGSTMIISRSILSIVYQGQIKSLLKGFLRIGQ